MSRRLSPNLLFDVRRVLAECSEFRTFADVRELFMQGMLYPFRVGLPDADTPRVLVNSVIDLLIYERTSDGRPALAAFLELLRDQYDPFLARHRELDDLFNRVTAEFADRPAARLSAADRNTLFNTLGHLGFDAQLAAVENVRAAQNNSDTAAFLIHGPAGHGQHLLARRIIGLMPGLESGYHMRIAAGSFSIAGRPAAVLPEMARYLHLDNSAGPAAINEAIRRLRTSRAVTITLDGVEHLGQSLDEWLIDFWQPLARQTGTHMLTLLLIDNVGATATLPLAVSELGADDQFPARPLRLPEITSISAGSIGEWMTRVEGLLPAGLTADMLHEQSDFGIPQLLIDIICDQCGLSWQGDFTAWLAV